jgi:hypothetical protein
MQAQANTVTHRHNNTTLGATHDSVARPGERERPLTLCVPRLHEVGASRGTADDGRTVVGTVSG